MTPPRLLAAALALLAPLAALADSRVPKLPLAPSEPGIFGVGFTNLTDTSARLVFTTSEPVKAVATVTLEGQKISRVEEKDFAEIHALPLESLAKGKNFLVSIQGKTLKGVKVSSEEVGLVPLHRPASSHQWPGYTIFGTSVESEADYDLLAAAGVKLVRIEASFYDLFFDGPTPDKAFLDGLVHRVQELKKRGIETLIVLDYCVPWAKPYTNTTMTWRHPSFGPPDRLADWELYLRTVVAAVGKDVKYYEIWNEPDAGYLATGSFVERPNLPPPIGRPPFKDNWAYWLGDRFVPMIEKVRAIMDELQPGAIVMNGGWNRDYTGQRGDLLFERGAAPYLDVYAFHTYCADPMSFARWHQAIDGGFRQNIDRIFRKHAVSMPLAITEWGWPAWKEAHPEKGFVTFADAQKFLLKSTFYFLAMQRVEILVQFHFGVGPDTRDKDPLFFMLINRDKDGQLVFQPSYYTFKWLATTLGSRPYRALPVKVTPAEGVRAYALQLQDSGKIYLAAWQDGVPDAKGALTAAPAREVAFELGDLKEGHYSGTQVNLQGEKQSAVTLGSGSRLTLKFTLPEVSVTAESDPVIMEIQGGGL